jgi:hypothetical protein
MGWVVRFTTRPLYPGERPSGTHWIGGWVGPKPVWTRWWGGKFPASGGTRTPDLPARSPVLYHWAIPAPLRTKCGRTLTIMTCVGIMLRHRETNTAVTRCSRAVIALVVDCKRRCINCDGYVASVVTRGRSWPILSYSPGTRCWEWGRPKTITVFGVPAEIRMEYLMNMIR